MTINVLIVLIYTGYNLKNTSGMREIRDLTFKEYRAIRDFISVSELKTYSESPALYKKKYINGEKSDEKNKDSLILGTFLHALLYEPKTISDEFHVYTKIDGRTAEGKAQVKELESMTDKIPISSASYEFAQSIINESRIKLSELCSL